MPVHKTEAFGDSIRGPIRGPIPWMDEEAAAMGEHEFRLLYDATAQPVLAYLTGVTGRRDVAEDLLQETYCRFLTRRRAAMEESETRRYLFRIATNLLRDRWRRGEDRPSAEMAEQGFLPKTNTEIDVRMAMRALKPRERELLWLAYVEGMNHAEIAAATGLSALSIRLLLFRARRRAAALLRPEERKR